MDEALASEAGVQYCAQVDILDVGELGKNILDDLRIGASNRGEDDIDLSVIMVVEVQGRHIDAVWSRNIGAMVSRASR